MEPSSEVMPYGLELVGARKSVAGKDQAEYISLPALLRHNGEAITCWEFSADEIEDVIRTKRIYLTQLTFGQKVQPILPQTESEFLGGFGFQVTDEVKSALELFGKTQSFNPPEAEERDTCLICEKPFAPGHYSIDCLAKLKAEKDNAQLAVQGFQNWALKLADYVQPAQTSQVWCQDIIDVVIARLEAPLQPIDMILPCPRCGRLHVDAPEPENGWANPPHKSHLCHGCGLIFRPADVPTNGVAVIKTRGENDSPIPVNSNYEQQTQSSSEV